MDGGWMWGHGWGWAGWLVMCLVMLLFWTGLVAATVAGVRYLVANRSQYSRPPARFGPEELLAHRYARGDIDDDEYRRRLTTLREHRVA